MKKINYLIVFLLLSAAVSASNIIITPDSLHSKAAELKQIHDSKSIASEIVNLSYIANNYNDNTNISVTGSDSVAIPYSYDKSLAKKIMNYLNSNSFDSVTLFGDSSLIPPSYYVYDSSGTDTLDRWIPTDYFYSVNLGRIPVKTEQGAANYIAKLSSFYSNADFNRIVLAGSDPSSNYRYYGELITNRIADELAGKSITKLYSTKQNFKEQSVKDILQNGNTGLLYIAGHGTINQLQLDDSTLYADEIKTLQKAASQPVILSSLCSNAAFDTSIAGSQESIGESMIISESGATAFLGSSRLSYGLPAISYNNSAINIEESRYMSELMELIIQSYKSGKTSLGEITKQALISYKNNNDMNDALNIRTLYEFSLLGDPTLRLQLYSQGAVYTKPKLTLLNPAIPGAVYAYEPGNITVSISTNSPATNMKVLKAGSIIASSDVSSQFSFSASSAGIYMIIAENPDSKETRMLLNVSEGINPRIYSLETPVSFDFDISERNTTVSKQFAVTNRGDMNLGNLTIKPKADRIYNITVSPSNFDLAVGESKTITVSSFIPLYASAGLQSIGSIEFYNSLYSKTITLNSNAKNNIEIADIKVWVDGKRRTVSSPDTVINAKPGSSLKIEAEVENLMADTGINSAEIRANITEISYNIKKDEYSDLEDESSSFSIKESGKNSETVVFTVPEIVEKGTHPVNIAVNAVDDNAASYKLNYRFLLNIEKENHRIDITSLELDYDSIDCNSYTDVFLEVTNLGENDEDAALSIASPALGINIQKDIFLSSEIDSETNSYSQSLEINGKNIAPAKYPITVTVERDGEIEDSKEVTLEVLECPAEKAKETVSEYETTAMQNMEDVNSQAYSQKESFKDTSTYKMLIAVLVVLWIGFVIFVIGAAVILISKRR